jgi:hypothetical protein
MLTTFVTCGDATNEDAEEPVTERAKRLAQSIRDAMALDDPNFVLMIQ